MKVGKCNYEVNYLKALLDESEVKEEAAYNLLLQENNNIQIELEEEVKFQRDLNDNLSLQLLKRQQEGKHENSLAGEGKAEGDMLQKLNLEIETLESDCLVKDMEIERQSNHQKDLETQLSKLQTINSQLKGTIKSMQTDTTIMSECLQKVKTDMVVYNSKKDSQVTAKRFSKRNYSSLKAATKS